MKDFQHHAIAILRLGDDDDNGDDDEDGGYPAYSHHDKIPPWWGSVSNDEGGNVSVSKTHQAPYTMMNYILEFICISGNPYNIWQLRNEYSN